MSRTCRLKPRRTFKGFDPELNLPEQLFDGHALRLKHSEGTRVVLGASARDEVDGFNKPLPLL